jgi:hypothetical protein
MDEKNTLGNIEFTEMFDNPVIKSTGTPYPESFYFSKFYDEAEYKRFIKNTERLIRTSKEYTKYLELLHTNITALNMDNILSNITAADAEFEFHHYPLTLYDIVDIVSSYKFLSGEAFNSFTVAKTVLDEHFKNTIGLVPLTKTNHELAHAGALFLSSKQVFGNYTQFMKTYETAISIDIKERIKKIEELTNDQNSISDIRGLF